MSTIGEDMHADSDFHRHPVPPDYHKTLENPEMREADHIGVFVAGVLIACIVLIFLQYLVT